MAAFLHLFFLNIDIHAHYCTDIYTFNCTGTLHSPKPMGFRFRCHIYLTCFCVLPILINRKIQYFVLKRAGKNPNPDPDPGFWVNLDPDLGT
jgi:hypothetical protein